ncbi:MAG: cell wall hydrolase [Pseudomonadota bacterium]
MKWLIGLSALGLVWWGLRMRDIDNLARTMWGEARGEGIQGMQAVANVVMNRVNAGRWFSGTVSQVVKKPFQFSVWNEGDPNLPLMKAVDERDNAFLTAVEIAARAMRGTLEDITGGATHYHTVSVNPPWADTSKITARIGKHIFYKGIA